MPCKLIRESQRYLYASQRELWPGTKPSLLSSLWRAMEGISRYHTGLARPKFSLVDHPQEITFCRSSHPKSGHGELSSVADPVTSLLQEFGSVRAAPLADVSLLLLSRPGVLFFTDIQTLQLSQLP